MYTQSTAMNHADFSLPENLFRQLMAIYKIRCENYLLNWIITKKRITRMKNVFI